MTTLITNSGELKSLAATFHDARFTGDGFRFDPHERVFSLKAWALEAKPQCWQPYLLSFREVAACRVKVKESIQFYELATIRYSENEGKLDLVTHFAVEMSLTIDRLEIEVTRDESHCLPVWESGR